MDIGVDAKITPLQFNISDEEHSDIAGSGLGFSTSKEFLKVTANTIYYDHLTLMLFLF